MGYNLKGSLLEVCDCQVLCPCWIGEDPDNGRCKAALAYQFDKGTIDGIDVSGLVFAAVSFIPGNVLAGNWRTCIYVDDRATGEQQNALLSVFKGEKGGPIADLAKLIGEVVSVERAKLTFDVKEGRGTLTIGDVVHAEMQPYQGPTGQPTKLVESIFSTIPGSPAFVAKASTYRVTQPALDIKLDLKNHNAIQGHFAFEG